MTSLFEVTIDFDRSHLFFPALVCAVLAILGLALLVVHRRAVASAAGEWGRRRGRAANVDGTRLFGTIAITVVYFAALRPVGERFPNTGLGFVICSVPALWALGALYLHRRRARELLGVTLCALIAPTLVWYLLSRVLGITLP